MSAWCCVVCVAAPYCRCHVCRPLIPLCCVMSQPLSPPRVSDGQPVLRDGLLTIPFPLPPVLLCPVENCGTRYANTVPTSMRQSLKRHIVRAHPGLLSATVWKCLGCGVQMVYPSRHVCRAQGLPPTPVTMPHMCGCGGSFTTRRGLTNHRRYCRLSPTRSLPSLPGDVSTDIDYDDLSDHARPSAALWRSPADTPAPPDNTFGEPPAVTPAASPSVPTAQREPPDAGPTVSDVLSPLTFDDRASPDDVWEQVWPPVSQGCNFLKMVVGAGL